MRGEKGLRRLNWMSGKIEGMLLMLVEEFKIFLFYGLSVYDLKILICYFNVLIFNL